MTPAARAFQRALRLGLVIDVAVGVLGAVIGVLVAGVPGLVSGLAAGAIGIVLTAIALGSLIFAQRLIRNDPGNPLFFGVIMGAWIVRFVIFLVLVLVLRDQAFIQPVVLYVGLIAVLVGGVAADVVAVLTSRVPNVEPPESVTDSDVP